MPVIARFTAGSAAGAIAQTAIFPMEVSHNNNMIFSSVFQTFLAIIGSFIVMFTVNLQIVCHIEIC